MNATSGQCGSKITIRLIVGAIVGAAVGSVSGDAGECALVGGFAETDHGPVTRPRKIVDRCMKTRGLEILSDPGKGT